MLHKSSKTNAQNCSLSTNCSPKWITYPIFMNFDFTLIRLLGALLILHFSLGAGNNGGGVLRTISESVSQKEAQGKGGRHAVIRR